MLLVPKSFELVGDFISLRFLVDYGCFYISAFDF